MSVGFERWWNNKRYTIIYRFTKTNLTFREAVFETAKDIRARSNKEIILPLSGGIDSTMMYHVFKDLGIEFKTIHQRYWTKSIHPLMDEKFGYKWKTPGLINEYESRNVDLDTVDILQDIQVEDFIETKWFKDMWIKKYPVPWFAGLQTYIRFLLNPETDIVVGGFEGLWRSTTPDYHKGVLWNDDDNPPGPTFLPLGTGTPWTVGLYDFDYAGFNNDNGLMLYTRYRNTPDSIMKGTRLDFFNYHFPELKDRFIPKFKQEGWPLFSNWKDGRKKYGDSGGAIFHVTYPFFGVEHSLDEFFDLMDSGTPMIATGQWNRDMCSAYSIENINMLSDETEYHAASRPHPKDL